MGKWKLGLCVVLVAGIMSACSPKEGKEIPEEPTATQTAEVTNAPTQEVTLTPSPTPTQTPALQEVLAEHNMKAGTCLSDYMIKNKKCIEIITGNFNSVTFENLLNLL